LKVKLVSSSQPSKELAEQGIINAQELVALELIFPMVTEFIVK